MKKLHGETRDAGGLECRICGGAVHEFIDFGRQPVSNAFVKPEVAGDAYFYQLAVGICESCTMVQQLEEVPRDVMFHADYPYRSSLSSVMLKHFENAARQLLLTELNGENPFVVEIGCNDGIFLKTINDAGVRHLGVDPSGGAAEVAQTKGIQVRNTFFEESSALEVKAEHGPADVIFSANTFSHIAYLDSVLAGVYELLSPDGIFVFEDRYLGDIIENTYFDQIYDEHFYLFSGRSVANMAAHNGFELVDVEHLSVHGGAVRYTVARAGARRPSAAVAALLAQEDAKGLGEVSTYLRFADRVRRIRTDLVDLLTDLRDRGLRVVGYGATSKSATVTSFFGIGPDLVPFICDSTPEKQGTLAPGSGIPVRPSEDFSDPYPDYALLFAWNHAEEILAKETEFLEAGGRWIFYVPDVHVVDYGADERLADAS